MILDRILILLLRGYLEEIDPNTYTKHETHEASTELIRQMSLNMISQIERLNNVQINVFQYQKRDFIPIIVSKPEK